MDIVPIPLTKAYVLTDDALCPAYIPLKMIASMHINPNYEIDSSQVVITTVSGREFVTELMPHKKALDFCRDMMDEISEYNALLAMAPKLEV